MELVWYKKGFEAAYSDGDAEQAFKYWKKGAEEGCTRSMMNLAACYSLGWGCERDREKAMYWQQQLRDNN